MVTMRQRKSDWREHIKRWKRSGLTQTQYCNEHDIAYRTFCTWKARLSRSEKRAASKAPALVELPPQTVQDLTLSAPAQNSSRMVLQVGEFHVALYDDFSVTSLRRLVRLLRGE